jgi:hypothetical protein
MNGLRLRLIVDTCYFIEIKNPPGANRGSGRTPIW